MEYKIRLAAALQDLNEIKSQSELKLLQASNEITRLNHRNNLLTEASDCYKGMAHTEQERVKTMLGGWQATTDLLKTTATSLVKSRKRMHTWSEQNGFAIMIKNCCVEPLPYYTIRCRNENMEPAMKRFKSRYPNSRQVFATGYVPNGINLFHQLKQLPGAQHHLNHYDLPCSEEELRTILHDMCFAE
jgi:hypothetical protein